MSENFGIRDLGPIKRFLGMNVKYDPVIGMVRIDQMEMITRIATEFGVVDSKPIFSPMENRLQIAKQDTDVKTTKPYQELLRKLMYVMLCSRPDICFCISYFGQFQANPTDETFTYLPRVLKYLWSSRYLSLNFEYRSPIMLEGYADADYANDCNDCKSFSEAICRVFGNVIHWMSRKQKVVALSSTEAEVIALCSAACELIFLKKVMEDLGTVIEQPISLFEDNQSAIKVIKNFRNNRRVKHLEIKCSFLLDLCERKACEIKYVDTSHQLADAMTKSLPNVVFKIFLQARNLQF